MRKFFNLKFKADKVERKFNLITKTQVSSHRPDLLLICPVYPGGSKKYGGEFIKRRVSAYLRFGMSIVILEVNEGNTDESWEIQDEVEVYRCNQDYMNKVIEWVSPKQIGAHQVDIFVWSVLKLWKDILPISIWIHGNEARDWRELEACYSKREIRKLKHQLEKLNFQRRKTIKEILECPEVNTIVVSAFMLSVAEKFTDAVPKNTRVIHNVISEYDFPYSPKTANDRFNVLWLRSFNSYNYSNDLSRDAILTLSRLPEFKLLKFTVLGDGPLFERSTSKLRKFKNVTIKKGFLTTQEIRLVHKKHGIILVPSRWESQGLTCGEGMSSGLVPITTNVTALPEFVDDSCGYLCEIGDASTLAHAIVHCVKNPDIFMAKSEKAARRAQRQCGEADTILKEIEVFKSNARIVN